MKISYTDALTYALNNLNPETDGEVIEKLSALRSTIANRNAQRKSEDSRAKANAKRKEKTSAERKAIVDVVAPVIRKFLSANGGMTAKAIYESVADELPADFSANKVQYLLLHEMAGEVVKTETKGQANTYALA